jgi:thermitase
MRNGFKKLKVEIRGLVSYNKTSCYNAGFCDTMNRWIAFAVVFCLSTALGFGAAPQTNSLVWHKADGSVDADLHGEALLPLLKNISAQTGWHIFVEPGASHTASTTFKNLPAGDALKRLLGDLNFALVPKLDGPSELYVFVTTMKNATRQVVAATPAKHVPNELLVKLKPGTDVKALAKILGAKVTGQIDKSGVYRLQFADSNATDAALAQLQNNSDVQAVDYNYYFDPPAEPQSISPGSPTASPLSLQLSPPPASGKTIVGLIDTDVQSLGPNLDQFVLKQIDVADGTAPDSGITHGTAMAYAILQAIQSASGSSSTSVQIQPVNVYSGTGEQTTSWDVAQGIQQAVNSGATILNMSLGSSSDSSVLDYVVAEAAKDGITMFAASGNTPMNAPYYPAADAGVIPVTALSQPGQLASYANVWNDPSMIALPGTGIVYFHGVPWEVQGTSLSTALATGAYYGNMATHNWTPAQTTSAMIGHFTVPRQ